MTVDRENTVSVQVVGFNPFREQDNSVADIAMVVIALVAIVAVVAWAIWG